MDDPILTLSKKPLESRMQPRPSYKADADQEQFIVPLLLEKITLLLQKYAVPNVPNAHALDAGCGRQPFRGWLMERGLEYSSCDVQQSPEGTVDFVCPLDGELAPELRARGPFNFILCTEVMEHVADWPTAFTNLASILAPGGRLLVTCPFLYPLHEQPYDFWRPTPFALRHYASINNLRVVEEMSVGDGWDVLGTILATCHTMPASRKLVDRAGNWVAAKLLRSLQHSLIRHRIQKHVQLHARMFLSNLVVLERS